MLVEHLRTLARENLRKESEAVKEALGAPAVLRRGPTDEEIAEAVRDLFTRMEKAADTVLELPEPRDIFQDAHDWATAHDLDPDEVISELTGSGKLSPRETGEMLAAIMRWAIQWHPKPDEGRPYTKEEVGVVSADAASRSDGEVAEAASMRQASATTTRKWWQR